MKKSINLLFWGYLIVLIRIDFGIDIIPVPLGYLIIATGCNGLEKTYPVAQKAWAFATALIFISFPTIFLDVYEQTPILWQTYALVLLIFQLIVVYFLLQVGKEIVADYGNPLSKKRWALMTNVYLISHLVYLAAMTLTVNIALEDWMLFMAGFAGIILAVDVVFLISLRTIRRKAPVSLDN